MFEHRSQPLLPRAAFFRRLVRHAGFGLGIVFGSLGLGILGYHGFEGLSWVDSLLNASMILGGMGPVGELHTTAGKLFASFYALYSGVVFLVAAGTIFAPAIHRFLHRFNLERGSGSESPGRPSRKAGRPARGRKNQGKATPS
jgi:hypothetical protein